MPAHYNVRLLNGVSWGELERAVPTSCVDKVVKLNLKITNVSMVSF